MADGRNAGNKVGAGAEEQISLEDGRVIWQDTMPCGLILM